MPEAVIVATARTPIGRAFKGSLKDLRPDDLAAAPCAPRSTRCRRSTRDDRRPDARLRPARRASRASTWPASSPCCSATTSCPAPRSPATAPPRCRPRGWRCTRSRPARATCSSPRASSPSPATRAAAPTRCRTPRTRSSPTPRPAPGQRRGGRGDLARPPRGRPAAGRLHRDGPDGREPRAAQGRQPRATGRVRRALAEPGREGDQPTASGPARSPRSPCRTAPSSRRTTARAQG